MSQQQNSNKEDGFGGAMVYMMIGVIASFFLAVYLLIPIVLAAFLGVYIYQNRRMHRTPAQKVSEFLAVQMVATLGLFGEQALVDMLGMNGYFAPLYKMSKLKASSFDSAFSYALAVVPLTIILSYVFSYVLENKFKQYSKIMGEAIDKISLPFHFLMSFFEGPQGGFLLFIKALFLYSLLTVPVKLVADLPIAKTGPVAFQVIVGSIAVTQIIFFFSLFARNKGRARVKDQTFTRPISPEEIPDVVKLGTFEDGSPLHLGPSDINHHIHVLGQPGAGKSVLLRNIYMPLVASGQGLMMLDLKADVDVKKDFILASSQRNRSELLIFDISNPDQSVGYNPLAFGTATELKDRIINALDWSEPFYKKMSERYLLVVLKGLVALRDRGLKITLEDVNQAISSKEALNILAEEVGKVSPMAAEDLLDLAQEVSKDKEILKALTGLRADLESILKSDFGMLFTERKSINLKDVILSNSVLYVMLDGQNLPIQTNRIGRMFLSELRAVSGYIVSNLQKEDRSLFTVIVDEFSDLVNNEESAQLFTGFLNRCRGSKIGVITAHQSLGDFKESRVASQILDSTETLISFVQKDPDTCEKIAGILGTQETIERTKQVKAGILFDHFTGLGTEKVVQEFRLHPNVIKDLEVGMAVYIAKKPTRYGVFSAQKMEVVVPQNNFAQGFGSHLVMEDNSPQLNLRRKRRELTDRLKSSSPQSSNYQEESLPHDFIT